MKTCTQKKRNPASWQRKVEQVLRKLKYQKARKRQWGAFWSVGFYGWLWNKLYEERSTYFFDRQAHEIELRIVRIEDRYVSRNVVCPA